MERIAGDGRRAGGRVGYHRRHGPRWASQHEIGPPPRVRPFRVDEAIPIELELLRPAREGQDASEGSSSALPGQGETVRLAPYGERGPWRQRWHRDHHPDILIPSPSPPPAPPPPSGGRRRQAP